MAGRAVIIREAEHADLEPLAALTRKVLAQQNVLADYDPTEARFAAAKEQGFRLVVLFDERGLLAALVASPLQTDRGLAFEIKLFAIDRSRAERLDLADALALWAMNVAQSEGYRVVVSRRRKDVAGTVYGRDVLDMETYDGGGEWVMWGTMTELIKSIYERHPEWARSLSSMTAT